MKLPVPLDLTHAQAVMALSILEYLIDALMDFYYEMRRVYGITAPAHDDELPF